MTFKKRNAGIPEYNYDADVRKEKTNRDIPAVIMSVAANVYIIPTMKVPNMSFLIGSTIQFFKS